MDAAFGFVPTLPPARARVFARRDLMRARLAPDRGETARNQRMARQIVAFKIGRNIPGAPIDQRVDLEPPGGIAGVDFEPRQVGARFRLETFAPGTLLSL